jgi:hypothetical protein
VIDHPALPFLKRGEKGKVVSAADAVKLIQRAVRILVYVGSNITSSCRIMDHVR